jgi:hypothetical protein
MLIPLSSNIRRRIRISIFTQPMDGILRVFPVLSSLVSSSLRLVWAPNLGCRVSLHGLSWACGLGKCRCLFPVRPRFIYVLPVLRNTIRYYLRYHSSTQVLAGAGIGVLFGFAYFGVTEFLPTRYAASPFGLVRVWLVGNPLSTWIRIRDGWAVWSDGGNEIEWKEWRKEWEHQRFAQTKVRKE